MILVLGKLASIGDHNSMDFKMLSQAVASIIRTIENTAVSAVRAIKANNFQVTVTNPIKTQAIKGTVTVDNQKKVERVLTETHATLKDLRRVVLSYKSPDEIKVKNFPAPSKFPEFPRSFNVNNFPKYPKFPTSFTVDNQPVENLKSIESELNRVFNAIKELKLDPKISVTTPKAEKIVVPAPSVSVTQQEIDYDKLAEAVSSKFPEIDYQKLATVLGKEIGGMIVTTGSSGSRQFSYASGHPDKALLDEQRRLVTSPGEEDLTRKYQAADKDESSPSSYYGFTSYTGSWYILKEDSAAGSYRYVKGGSDYSTNWTNRVSLTYDYYHNTFSI